MTPEQLICIFGGGNEEKVVHNSTSNYRAWREEWMKKNDPAKKLEKAKRKMASMGYAL